MKKPFVILTIILSGCAKVGDYQAKCEQIYPAFSDMVNCLDNSIRSDTRLALASTPKLYVLAAKTLSQNVNTGKISEPEARLELQKIYVNMQRQERYDMQAQIQASEQSQLDQQKIKTLQTINNKVQSQPLQKSSTNTTCQRWGNTVNCNSY
ncbi:hypothetical protein EHW65_13945 [Erwinia psidii]|uniref:hypothetical protein n=1 Tax=Erwinia psidii TaxID=69224 RepID=UPI00226B7EB2|nr:hypothetical protein [Erwinia psidii]MCX8958312.1 hypothetical protein [Erwinia psidii]